MGIYPNFQLSTARPPQPPPSRTWCPWCPRRATTSSTFSADSCSSSPSFTVQRDLPLPPFRSCPSLSVVCDWKAPTLVPSRSCRSIKIPFSLFFLSIFFWGMGNVKVVIPPEWKPPEIEYRPLPLYCTGHLCLEHRIPGPSMSLISIFDLRDKRSGAVVEPHGCFNHPPWYHQQGPEILSQIFVL